MNNKRKKAGRKIDWLNRKKKDKPINIKKIETVEEAVARGVEIEVLPPQNHADILNKVNAAITEARRKLWIGE